ncbi:uncharacterized protein LOC129601686 [Paramacrobiotus metropolitanus]|uniref:uncharacterized protein LOC129601686 n=1 Tax=Paramacrobiotus metropolitanus TaxID=2943436 RepID=UPI00244619B7|nr:uncharacterized protein LOC129601686 [Paramacrobiotus metropolitanus]
MSLSIAGAVQILCGIIIFICDVIGMGMWWGISLTKYTGFVSGIIYFITGIVTRSAVSAARQSKSNTVCLAITVLVMGIICSLLAFGLAVYDCVVVDAYAKYLTGLLKTGWCGIVGAQLAFQIVMLIASITACVYSSKNISAPIPATAGNTATTTTTTVTMPPGKQAA